MRFKPSLAIFNPEISPLIIYPLHLLKEQSAQFPDIYTSNIMAIHRLIKGFLSKDKDPDKEFQNSESQLVQGTLDPAQVRLTSVSPSNTVPQTKVIPKNILAFRLITKTLSGIPQTQTFTSIDNLGDNNRWTAEDRQEVNISDAFAHLAVAEHDVVAILWRKKVLAS